MRRSREHGGFALAAVGMWAALSVAAQAQVRGRVRLEGRPAAAARIGARPFESFFEEARREARRQPPPEELVTATAGPDGSFTLNWPARGKGAAPPALVLSITAEGAGERRLERLFTPSDTADLGELELSHGHEAREARRAPAPTSRPAARRALDVVVERGQPPVPAAGALVRFEGAPASPWLETGADGRVRIDGVPAEGGRLVALAPDGAATLDLRRGQAEPLTLTLAPTGTLHGRVVDARGAPAPGRWLLASGEWGRAAVVAGRDGAYEIAGLPAGRYRLSVDDERAVPYVRSGLAVTAGARLRHDVRLDPAATLRGRVVDERGRPVADATGVIAAPRADASAAMIGLDLPERIAAFRSLADGSFNVGRLAPGSGRMLSVSHPDFSPASIASLTLAAESATPPLQVVLRRGASLSGRVHDAQGRPIAGATLQLQRAQAPEMPYRLGRRSLSFMHDDSKAGASDATGRFEFKGLEEGRYTLHVRAQGWADEDVERVRVEAAGAAPLEVVLRPGAALRGVVLDSAGEPAAGRTVMAYEATADKPMPGPWSGQGTTRPTAADGSFSIEGLVAGQSYDLRLSPLGAPPLGGVVAPAEGLELRVRRVGRIEGRVSDADSGRALTAFEVAYEWPEGGRPRLEDLDGGPGHPGQPHEVRADDGSFTVEGVPPGVWDVRATADGYQPSRVGQVTVEEGETTAVDLRLTRGTTLTGRVVAAADSKPIQGASVSAAAVTHGARSVVRLVGGDAGAALTDAEGRFRLEGLGSGTYAITAWHSDWAAAAVDVSLGREGRGDVELRLRRGASVSGIVSAGGQPVADAAVTLHALYRRGGLDFTSRLFMGREVAHSDAGGRFAFEHLPGDKYHLSAQHDKGTSAGVTVELSDDQVRAGLRLELRAGATLHGRVSGLEPDELASVHVSASATEWREAGEVEPDGTFTLRGAPPGLARVTALLGTPMGSMRAAHAAVTVPEGVDAVAVELRFERGLSLEGRVTRAGAPAVGVDLLLLSTPDGVVPQVAHAVTGPDGTFAFNGVRIGSHQLDLTTPSGTTLRRALEVGGPQTIEIEVPAGRQAGQVVDQAGRPVASAWLALSTADGSQRAHARSDSNGRFVFEDVGLGAVTVEVRHPGHPTRTLQLNVGDGEDWQLKLPR